MFEYAYCPACLSGSFQFQFEAKDHTVSGESFRIVECTDCSLRFTNPIPEEGVIGKYYQSEDYISHSNTSKGLINKVYQWVRNYTLGQKLKFIQKISGIKSGGSLLDVGCGTGDFLGRLKNAGWEVSGVEPDEGARSLALQNYGIEVKQTDGFYEMPDGHYDVITLWHVLEHVHQLDKYIDKIVRMLKDGGTLVIAVPNYLSFDAQYYGSAWAAYDVPRHLYHFSPQAMRTLLGRFGLSVKDTRIMPFDSFYVSMLSEKYKGGSLLSAVWVGFRSWLAALSQAEKCSSVIYVIQRNDN